MNVYSILIFAFVFFLLCILFLIFSFHQFKKSKLRSLLFFLISIIFFFLTLCLLFFFQSLRTYNVLTRQDLIAKIRTERIAQDTLIVYFDSDKLFFERPSYLIVGEQWEIQGIIVKWKTYLEFLGIHTAYKITRLKGRYTAKEKKSTSSYVLQEEDFFTKLLMKYGERIFFIDAVYGQGIFQFPSEKPFYLYITIDGFILKRENE